MITRIEHQDQPVGFPGDRHPVYFPETLMAGRRRKSGSIASSQTWARTEQFHPRAVERLYLAIVNRAILDVLENGEESDAAERWLLSRDFDRLQELFG
jgi:hypothetical protein